MAPSVRPVALLGLLFALWSCNYAMSTLQEPRTLAPGKVRASAQGRIGQSEGPYQPPVRSALDVGLNVGLPARLELQLAGSTAPGGRLGIKALLVDWPSLTLAVVPTYQMQRMSEDFDALLDEELYPEYLVQTFIAPVIVGLPLGPSTEALLGIDVHAGRRRHEREDGPVLAFGGHVGLAVRGPRGHGTVIPQCGVLVSALSAPRHLDDPYGDYGYDRTYDALRRGSLRWECALGFTVGARMAGRAN